MHAEYSEVGLGINGCVIIMPCISKIEQIVIITNSNIIQPRVYVHIHKLHYMHGNWALARQCKECNISEQIAPLVEDKSAGLEVMKTFKINQFCIEFSLVM